MCDLQANQVQLVFRALLVRKGFRETFVTVCLFSDVIFAVGMLLAETIGKCYLVRLI